MDIDKDTSKKRKKISYRSFIRINGKLTGRTFSRKADADRWYEEKKREKKLIESGLEIKRTESTFEKFASNWLKTRKANGQPLSSYQQEEARLRLYILPAFGSREITSIKTVEWERFLDQLNAKFGLNASTRNRVRALLSKLYNDARRQQVVDQNPILLIPKLKEMSKKWDFWQTTDECGIYLNNARTDGLSFYIFACIALNAGARVGEIIALDHEDIDLQKRRMRIWRIVEAASGGIFERTKGCSERWLGINDSLYEAFMELKEHRGWPRNEPLISLENGARYSYRDIRTRHFRVCRNAELRSIRIHDLRHTFASHYVMNGGSLTELQGLLGHTSSAMTLKYAHLAPGFLESRSQVVSFARSSISESNPKMKLVISR